MKKQQTAVEKLVEEINKLTGLTIQMDEPCVEQALEMEKKQKEKDFIEGYKAKALASNLIFDKTSELFAKELFNKIFKSE